MGFFVLFAYHYLQCFCKTSKKEGVGVGGGGGSQEAAVVCTAIFRRTPYALSHEKYVAGFVVNSLSRAGFVSLSVSVCQSLSVCLSVSLGVCQSQPLSVSPCLPPSTRPLHDSSCCNKETLCFCRVTSSTHP